MPSQYSTPYTEFLHYQCQHHYLKNQLPIHPPSTSSKIWLPMDRIHLCKKRIISKTLPLSKEGHLLFTSMGSNWRSFQCGHHPLKSDFHKSLSFKPAIRLNHSSFSVQKTLSCLRKHQSPFLSFLNLFGSTQQQYLKWHLYDCLEWLITQCDRLQIKGPIRSQMFT